MLKKIFNKIKRNVNIDQVIILISILCIVFLVIFSVKSEKNLNIENKSEDKNIDSKNFKITLLFTGDIFLDRHIDELSQKSDLKYAYPFSGLKTLEKENYDVWVGNLECPVTEAQSTKYEKENYLKFSCKKEYLPELKKYFDIVSLANNHTDNMNGRKGIEETRKHLREVGVKYFGDFDNSKENEICKIIFIKNLPVTFCGFNGVYKLPTETELEIVKKYSKYFITFVMPHQGEEYKMTSNTYQKKIYKKIIDNGADAIFGSHPHVVEEVEDYKNKKIFYSLGNFIFDQSWVKTREHMTVKTEVNFVDYEDNYKDLFCENISSLECLEKAEKLQIQKPKLKLKFTPIYTHADKNFITTKK